MIFGMLLLFSSNSIPNESRVIECNGCVLESIVSALYYHSLDWTFSFCRQIAEIRNLFSYFSLIVSKCAHFSADTHHNHVEKINCADKFEMETRCKYGNRLKMDGTCEKRNWHSYTTHVIAHVYEHRICNFNLSFLLSYRHRYDRCRPIQLQRRIYNHICIVATVTSTKLLEVLNLPHFWAIQFIQICCDISELLNTFNRRRAAIQQTCFRKAHDRAWEFHIFDIKRDIENRGNPASDKNKGNIMYFWSVLFLEMKNIHHIKIEMSIWTEFSEHLRRYHL